MIHSKVSWRESPKLRKVYIICTRLISAVSSGAGRKCETQAQVRDCFIRAFAEMKPGDGVLVGMFDKYDDQPMLDARYTQEAIKLAEG